MQNAEPLQPFVSNKPSTHVASPSSPFSSPTAIHNVPLRIMPTCRRKRVLLTEPSQVLLDALKSDPKKEVYYLAQTGEIFETYEYISSL